MITIGLRCDFPDQELAVSRWVVSWRVTVHASYLLSKLTLPHMMKQGWGRIVNVTSESANRAGPRPVLE